MKQHLFKFRISICDAYQCCICKPVINSSVSSTCFDKQLVLLLTRVHFPFSLLCYYYCHHIQHTAHQSCNVPHKLICGCASHCQCSSETSPCGRYDTLLQYWSVNLILCLVHTHSCTDENSAQLLTA